MSDFQIIKKSKPPTFDGELNKPKDVEAWLLGMKKFFELHEYTENMKVRIVIFNLKGKAYIWWEDVKRVKDIRTKESSWHEFKRLSGRSTCQRGTMTIRPRSSMS